MRRGRIKILFLTFWTILIFHPGFTQPTKEQLQAEKQAALQKQQEAQKILEETQRQKQISLGQLAALNTQIEAGESLIGSINQEIGLINKDIDEMNSVIRSLEGDLDRLKQEYSVMAYNSYKSGFGLRDLTFIFSAATFSQLYMRMKYMEQYAAERRKQLSLIREVQQSLISQEKILEDKRKEKNNLLGQKISENGNLVELKNKQSRLITALSTKASELKSELETRKKAIAQLDRLIAERVAAEIRESTKGKSSDKVLLSGDMANLSKSFETNHSKLPWPVNSGFIASRFGAHPHPIYRKLSVLNNGIDIQTNSNEVVHAVFEGEVKTVAFIPGDMKYVVLIQHGQYFTVYAKLREVTVKKGQNVSANDPIGVVNTNSDGVSEVQFEIWRNNQKLDPENWIVKK